MKICKECGKAFPIEDFPKAGNKGTGRRARCTPCHNQREKTIRRQRAVDAGRPFKPRVDFDPASGTKWCPTCETVRPLDDFAVSSERGGSARQGECRSCRSVRGAKRRAEQPDSERERHRRYYIDNREKLLPKGRAWRKAWYYRDPEKARRAAREYWRGLTPVERTATLRRQRESRYRSWALWRARQLQSMTGPVSRRAIIARDASACYLCQRVLANDQIELDHVIPLSRGGSHTEDNIKVACQPCNRWKHTRLLEEL